MAEVDLSKTQSGLSLGQSRFGGQETALGRVNICRGDAARISRLYAFEVFGGLVKSGVGLLNFSLSKIDRGLVLAGVDREERLTGAHHGAVFEVYADDLARDLGPEIHGLDGFHASDVVFGGGEVCLADRGQHDGRSRLSSRLLLGVLLLHGLLLANKALVAKPDACNDDQDHCDPDNTAAAFGAALDLDFAVFFR